MISESHDQELVASHAAQKTGEVTSRKICMAVDQSAYSEYAFNWALENLAHPNDEFILLNVRSIPFVPGPFGMGYVDYGVYLSQIEEYNRSQSHTLLRHFISIIKQKGYDCQGISLRGDPREEIPRKIKEIEPAFVVLGSRGMGMVKRTLVGSVSDYLIHHASCPILVVKHPNPDQLPQLASHASQDVKNQEPSPGEVKNQEALPKSAK